MMPSILIVEDDEFFRKFYSTELAGRGFTVDVATNGEEALAKIRQQPPNLILLDIIMPKLDGFEVLKAMQTDPQLNKIPVLVFSTLGQESDVEKARQLGARDYINKSFFDLNVLVTKINTLLSKTS